MKRSILILNLLLILSLNSFGQTEGLQISDFFKPVFYPKGDSFGFYADVDSLKNTQFEDFGENMWAFSEYILANYSKVDSQEGRQYLEKLLPDTVAFKNAFAEKINNDTAFIKLYDGFLNKKSVSDITIEEIQKIAARFYYVHRPTERLTMHMCVGINGVLEMVQSEASPYYNAFGYMVIRNEDNYSDEWLSVKDELAPYFNADKENVSDEEVERIKNQVYENLANSEAYRQNIIKEYERRKQYLNFKILY